MIDTSVMNSECRNLSTWFRHMFITLYCFFCFIKRWYPVMSPNDDKLAELEVSLHLETVTGTLA